MKVWTLRGILVGDTASWSVLHLSVAARIDRPFHCICRFPVTVCVVGWSYYGNSDMFTCLSPLDLVRILRSKKSEEKASSKRTFQLSCTVMNMDKVTAGIGCNSLARKVVKCLWLPFPASGHFRHILWTYEKTDQRRLKKVMAIESGFGFHVNIRNRTGLVQYG